MEGTDESGAMINFFLSFSFFTQNDDRFDLESPWKKTKKTCDAHDRHYTRKNKYSIEILMSALARFLSLSLALSPLLYACYFATLFFILGFSTLQPSICFFYFFVYLVNFSCVSFFAHRVTNRIQFTLTSFCSLSYIFVVKAFIKIIKWKIKRYTRFYTTGENTLNKKGKM